MISGVSGGYAINMAKRVEGRSREGSRYQILLSDHAMDLCRAILMHEPGDPNAMYHLALALRERGDPETACIILRELTAAWPRFGDGHWEMAGLLKSLGETGLSADSLRVARLLGVDDPLP